MLKNYHSVVSSSHNCQIKSLKYFTLELSLRLLQKLILILQSYLFCAVNSTLQLKCSRCKVGFILTKKLKGELAKLYFYWIAKMR